MKNQLFNKVACFTDIHFGKSSNSEDYNIKCEQFVDWFIEKAKAAGAETCIFLGDWHESRISLQVKTLNYSLRCMERLSEAFDNFYFIPGNHDIFHRTKREYNSIAMGRNLSNVNIINEIFCEGGVAIVPWLMGDEWKKVRKLKCRYMFGHFELPRFLMNAMVEMGDHSGLKAEDLKGPEFVFSGHFHKRQVRDNVIYIGNAFPQNYTDAWDDDRGMMLLTWGEEPEFFTWEDQPIFRTYNLSDIIEEPEKHIYKHVNARVVVDIEMSYEEAQLLKETFRSAFGASDIKFLQKHTEVADTDWDENIEFQSVDQIVIEGLNSLDEKSIYDKNLLVSIYNQIGE